MTRSTLRPAHPRRPTALVLAAVVLLAAALAAWPKAPVAAPGAKVTICHKVGGPQYVRITIAPAAAYNGHAKNHPDDIIPPFRFGSVDFPGQNWGAAGQEIWENGCVAPPSGEPITVNVACVAVNPATESYTVRFGYRSENVVERTIRVGADNSVSPGGPGRGQPEVFQAGAVDNAFEVAGVPTGDTITWSVTFAGRTSIATASSSGPPCGSTPPPKPSTGLFVTCVEPQADGTYSAVFGYQNDEDVTIEVPVGPDNSVTPGGPGRGQPSVFPPGRVDRAFTVSGVPDAVLATWTVRKGGYERSATASADGPACGEPPPVSLRIGIHVTCVEPQAGGTYAATFGYDNPNDAAVDVPVGDANNLSPGAENRGQPTTFDPGATRNAFTVSGIPEDQALTWTLAYQGTATATANASFPERCAGGPPQPSVDRVSVFLTCIQPGAGGRYSATFGYENPSDQTLVIEVGGRNTFVPAPADRGQPAMFPPGNVQAAFTVDDLPADARPQWRVTSGDGTVSAATATPDARNCQTNPPPTTGPGLGIDKAADASSVVVGTTVRYTLKVVNRGTGSSWGVRIRDLPGRGLRITGVQGAARVTCRRTTIVTCTTARLAPKARLTVFVAATPTTTGTLVNTGDVNGGGGPAGSVDGATTRRPITAKPRPRRPTRPSYVG